MNYIKTLKNVLLLVIFVSVTACSSKPDEEDLVLANKGEEALYQDARKSIELGNFNAAVTALNALDSRYPFGGYTHQVQLDLIYCNYKIGNTDQALAVIDRFVRLNPNHSDLDYVLYMRGLTNQDADKNLFQDMVGIDRSDRDPAKSREAFNDFRKLIEKYPNSKYAPDAKKRMVAIKNRLAKYELAIADFYMRREAFIAAANRGRYVLEYYPDSTAVQSALELMVAAYDKLDMQQLKENTLKTLRLNYPDSKALLEKEKDSSFLSFFTGDDEVEETPSEDINPEQK